MTRVLPLPGPAIMSSGPWPCSTAARCSGFNSKGETSSILFCQAQEVARRSRSSRTTSEAPLPPAVKCFRHKPAGFIVFSVLGRWSVDHKRWLLLTALALIVPARNKYGAQAPRAAGPLDSKLYAGLRWRMIGPFRGGRTRAATGVPSQPNVFYVGQVNGGVWKSDDYGRTWAPIFDDEPTQSVGAIAVAPSDPNIIYVGSGEGLHRPDLSAGDGIYKSTDGGRTWQHLGLRDAQQIAVIIVDPKDPNRVFVGAMGHPYGPNPERGVFRSLDGGQSWQRVLYKDDNTGAADLAFDPRNPQVIFADMWASRRPPWTTGGAYSGPGSGLHKSTDGGEHWQQLTSGLPGESELGRVGIGISPSEPDRMYAWVDAKGKTGIYRSDNAGESWHLVNSESRVAGRGDDFSCVRV